EASAGGNVAAIIQNSSATGAFADGFSMRIDGAGTTGSAAIQNFVGDGAGSSGAEFNVTNGAILRVNQFNNVSLQNTVWSGLDVNLTIGRIDAFNGSNVNVSGGMQSGMDLYLRQGFAKMTIDGLIADNNFERGVQILNIVCALPLVKHNNLSMQGN